MATQRASNSSKRHPDPGVLGPVITAPADDHCSVSLLFITAPEPLMGSLYRLQKGPREMERGQYWMVAARLRTKGGEHRGMVAVAKSRRAIGRCANRIVAA